MTVTGAEVSRWQLNMMRSLLALARQDRLLRFGGTCVNNGCIPTKTLVASARAAHVARRAGDYGVTIPGSIAVDMKKVKMRKDAVVRLSSEGLAKWLKNTQNLTVYEGHARFADAHRVRVGDELLEADKFFINVGGRAST